MAYRAHIQVYDHDGKRLGLAALKAAFPQGRHVGTRMGAPGLWVQGTPKDSFLRSLSAVVTDAVGARGYRIGIFATNQVTAQAVARAGYMVARG